ncbi:MAG: hypothetical protein M3093_04485 [Thermoproteota archaeon]|nr:hypothetical protein [Thermoproteota archaeon]
MTVNTFEVAVLRILVKRQQSLKLSVLVGGFPDEYEDSVLSAVSSLRLRGYIILDDYQPNGYVCINKERRKEILHIVNSDIYSYKSSPIKEEYIDIPIDERKSFRPIITRYPIPRAIRAVALSSLLIIGLVIALGSSVSTTSPDTESVAYHQYIPHKKWSSGYGEYDPDAVNDHHSSSLPASVSFVSIQNCNLNPSHQQT